MMGLSRREREQDRLIDAIEVLKEQVANLRLARNELLAACVECANTLENARQNLVDVAGDDSEEAKALEPAITQAKAAIAKFSKSKRAT